ncbi:MAG: SpoIIE family protein phosphatase [Planctomycetaceae bacterium]|nr:SpoIIE family protein phosphatase [Planctomycetaceae bacterium]
MAVLQVLKGLNPGQVFALDGEKMVLGRHPDCDIVLDVGAISRQHAQIIVAGDEYYVEDLHSRNGTLVNGQAIQGRYRLQENDRLKICDLLFTFHRQTPGAPPDDGQADRGKALMVDDEGTAPSTIMSKLDISSSEAGLRVSVRPEVKLRALIELTQSLGKTLVLDDVLHKILDSLFKIFTQADRGFVVLRMTEGGPLVPKAVKHRRPGAEETIRISRTIVNQVMSTKEVILSADAASDARFDMSQSIADFRIRSMMCAPLIDSEGKALGVLQIDTLDQRSRFKQEDLDVLASVAQQAAITVENSQLHERALVQQRLERDLDLAHQVQRGFLPSSPPQISGYEFFDFYDSALQLGGDYYDYIELPGGRMAIVVADVAGKGVPAALLMAKLSSDVRYCLASEPRPDLAMNRINATFASSGWQDRFVTMVLAVLDPAEHQVTLVNAGHMPPYWRRANGEIATPTADEAGPPLGVIDDYAYEAVSIQLAPGESLCLFTDGISEALNSAGELFGLTRLREQFLGEALGMQVLGRQILDGVRKFVGAQPQSDDMCLACIGRLV